MGADDVASFVANAGFVDAAEMFRDEGITGGQLQRLKKSALGTFGLTGLDRVRLLIKIQEKRGRKFRGTRIVAHKFLHQYIRPTRKHDC